MKDKMTKAIREIEKIKNKERSEFHKFEEVINTEFNGINEWSRDANQDFMVNYNSKINSIKEELIKSRSLYEDAFKSVFLKVNRESNEKYKKEMKSMMEAYRIGFEAIQKKINNEHVGNEIISSYDRRMEMINSILEVQKDNYYKVQKNATIAIAEAKKVVDVQKNAMKIFSKMNLTAGNKSDDFLIEARRNAANKINEYLSDVEIGANKFKLINDAKNASNKMIKEAMINDEMKKESVKAVNEINRALASQKKAVKAMVDSQKDILNIKNKIAKKNISNRVIDGEINLGENFPGRNDLANEAFLLEALDRLYSNEISIGEVVKELRVNFLKISQDEFGKITNTSRKTISDFENNTGNISEKKIKNIIKPFGLKLTLMPE